MANKLIMFDFECTKCEHTFDDLVYSEVREVPCPQCAGVATRLVATPHFDPRMGADTAFPTFAKQWAKRQAQRQKQVEYLRREHGDTR